MTDKTTMPARFIGCDVGKAQIHVFDSRDARVTCLPNDPEALTAWVAGLDETCLVICEATGGYEAALLDAVVSAGHAIHRADARKVKAFIRSFGTLAKTDALDARALARYGQERADQLARWQPRDQQRDQLHLLVSTRRDLVQQRVACSNRIAAPRSARVAPRLQRILDALDREIDALDKDIRSLVSEHQPLERDVKILTAIQGVGITTAVSLIAFMPELGSLDRRQAASLAGLAPHPKQSGSNDPYRTTRGGRPEIKQILFMAALAAARSNPSLKAFYNRLRSNGKKPIVAITALMRKIIVIANARLKHAQHNI
jgi:transposase